MFEQKTGRHNVTVGNIRPSLFDAFGEDASPKVKKFVSLIVSRLQSGESESFWGTVGALAQDFLKTKLDEAHDSSQYVQPALDTPATSHQAAYAGSNPELRKKRSADMGILVSGCQSDETSADANPTGNPKEAYGALSNAVQTILAQTDGPLTNRDLVLSVRKHLAQQGFKQHPCLFCSDENVETIFICE
ncbi:hypothetical protein O6H91_09G043100 [Diphasiastrum complanatum]|nr:hypothetical protein O6H91_Y055100 [Diphasiastrum complanatum]KAJ7543556.1 hypothetical protein O6H91_09G043100 [Diphasiastrum complanatum]